MQRPRRVLTFLLTLVLGQGSIAHLVGQDKLTENVVTDPNSAEFVLTDVENFIAAMDLIANGGDAAQVLERDYLSRATPGLLLFIEKYDLTVDRLIQAMTEHPEAYTSLRTTLENLQRSIPVFRRVYSDLRKSVPHAVFPPTYFVVAGHRGIGSGSVEGPLLSVEKERPEKIEKSLPPTLVHEMIHMQQLAATGPDYFAIFSGPERTLLATSVREGVATFFSELITGGSEHKNLAREFLLNNESRLWKQFEREMLGGEMGDWLWTDPADPEQPQDVGYAMGAQIAEAFYASTDDKALAARALLGVTDYPAFLEQSGYASRFD